MSNDALKGWLVLLSIALVVCGSGWYSVTSYVCVSHRNVSSSL